ELLPQTVNVRIDIPLITFVFRAPDSVEQVVTRPGTPRLGSQQIQNLKLKRRQIDSGSGARHFMTAATNHQVTDLQALFAAVFLDALTSAQQRLDAVLELARTDRFGQVIVGARLDARNCIVDHVMRSET